MGNQFFDPDDEEPEYVPGVSAEELRALEEERSVFDETEVQMASRVLKNNLVGAVHSVTKLALHSSNERVRLAASQYVIERNMGRIQDNAPAPMDDPIQELLADVVSELDPEMVSALVGDSKRDIDGDFKSDTNTGSDNEPEGDK